MDYFRGKDLFRLLRTQPELIDEYALQLVGVPATPVEPTAKDRDAQITAIGQYLLQQGYFVRCERVHKTPRPGRTKRVKFPKFLQQVPRTRQAFTSSKGEDDGFYSWTYDQPMSWTFVILAVAVAFLVILMCLFPLAPIWFKKVILYSCLGILGLFFVVFVVRVIVFAVVWIVAGRQFWIMPNITSDEIPIDEVFSPMWAFDDLDAEGKVVGKIPLLSRLAAAGAAGALLVALYWVAPEKGSAIKSINKAHGSILDLFDLYDTPKSLAGAMGNVTDAANATNATDTATIVPEDVGAGGLESTGAVDPEEAGVGAVALADGVGAGVGGGSGAGAGEGDGEGEGARKGEGAGEGAEAGAGGGDGSSGASGNDAGTKAEL